MKKRLYAVFLLAILLLTSCSEVSSESTQTETETEKESTSAQTEKQEDTDVEEIASYTNPLMTCNTENAWPAYGYGDPFVMRHNGKYYLYVSTKDQSVGIKCWSGVDLVNWTYEGFCTREKITKGAYAPEVYYYNGYFYMYTSPGGFGHYVLRSKSPTEGFEVITDNMGMSIDGSVFIDNDGKWYFYTAGWGTIQAYDMSSPWEMKNGGPLPGVSVCGGWTEGSMTVYHDGYYYITYTGNHVLSPSYRIYCASSAVSPLDFEENKCPMLVNTTNDVLGIGHSSTVKGPDLDSYYIVYHSLVDPLPNRNVNIDRIVFDGGTANVLGPTVSSTPMPAMPDIYHHFEPGSSIKGWQLYGSFGSGKSGITLTDGSLIVSKESLEGDFTAEYNLLSASEGAMAGGVFAYKDSENYGKCVFDSKNQKLIITLTASGREEVYEFDTVRSFDEDVRGDALQALQIERTQNTYTVYMNDRLTGTFESDALSGGGFGYIALGGNASFGFIGATGATEGRGGCDEYKPVSHISGYIPAFEYSEGEFETSRDGGQRQVSVNEGDSISYLVYAQNGGEYDLCVVTSPDSAASLEISVDGKTIASFAVEKGCGVLRGIPLLRGGHTVTLNVKEGSARLTSLTLLRGEETKNININFTSSKDGNVHSDGVWEIADGKITSSGETLTGKRLYGSKNIGDCTVKVNVTPRGNINCGLVVRATDPSTITFLDHDEDVYDALDGTDWLFGYFVGLSEGRVVLGKQYYAYTELASASAPVKSGQTYELKAVCRGAKIEVYLDGELLISYTDPNPFIQGSAGIRTCDSRASFEAFSISE